MPDSARGVAILLPVLWRMGIQVAKDEATGLLEARGLQILVARGELLAPVLQQLKLRAIAQELEA